MGWEGGAGRRAGGRARCPCPPRRAPPKPARLEGGRPAELGHLFGHARRHSSSHRVERGGGRRNRRRAGVFRGAQGGGRGRGWGARRRRGEVVSGLAHTCTSPRPQPARRPPPPTLQCLAHLAPLPAVAPPAGARDTTKCRVLPLSTPEIGSGRGRRLRSGGARSGAVRALAGAPRPRAPTNRPSRHKTPASGHPSLCAP